MPPVLQKTIREIHQRLRALETREYAEVVGPGSVINAQYLTLALHAVLTAERRFVDGDGLVGVDGGANADYTLDIDLVAAWSGLEFVGGELRVDEDADFTWTGTHTFNANILMGGGITIDGMDPSAFLVTYAAHDHSAGDPTQIDHGDLLNVTANQHHAENHVLLSAPHTDTLAAAVVDGDVIIGNVTPAWSRLAIAIPAANVRNVLGIDNAELRPSWKTALDNVNPANIGVAAPGVSLIFSHRDHVHAHPAGLGVNLHHTQIHDVVGGDHTLTGAQWNLVGATALNTIGLLLASSNPGAAAAILMSTAAGDLTLHDLTATGQLSAGAGIAEGIILGVDAQWYRSAANMLRTPDSVTIDVGLIVGTGTVPGTGEVNLGFTDNDAYIAPNDVSAFSGLELRNYSDIANAGALIRLVGRSVNVGVVHLAAIFPNADNSQFIIQTESGGIVATRVLVDESGHTSILGGLNVGPTATGAGAGEIWSMGVTADNAGWRLEGNGTNLRLMIQNTDGTNAKRAYAFNNNENSDSLILQALANDYTFTRNLVHFYHDGDVTPGGNKTQDLGIGGTAWDDCWADDFHNEPDLYHMDSRKNRAGQIASVDDLAVLRAIKPSGEYDARTGLPLIDDASLPEWVFTRDKNTGETLYYPDGKPCGISMKMVTGLSWGAIRQLDGHRLSAAAEHEALKEQIGIMQNRLAVLEAAQRRQ